MSALAPLSPAVPQRSLSTALTQMTPQERVGRLLQIFDDRVVTQEKNLPAGCFHRSLLTSGFIFVPWIKGDQEAQIDKLISPFLDYPGARELPYDNKVFVGQLSLYATPFMLAFLVICLAAKNRQKNNEPDPWLPVCVEKLGPRGGFSGCAWVFCKTPEERADLLKLNKHIVCDLHGVWIARDDNQARILEQRMLLAKTTDSTRIELAKNRLPRESVVVEKPTEDQRYAHHSYNEPQYKLTDFERQVLELCRTLPGPVPGASGSTELDVRCSNHHKLVPKARSDFDCNPYICNFCRQAIQYVGLQQVNSFRCSMCNFDVCNTCYERHAKAVSVPSFSPQQTQRLYNGFGNPGFGNPSK